MIQRQPSRNKHSALNLSRLGRLFRRFRRNRSGVAAVEFALLVPIMVIMYVGTVEVTEAVYVDRRVTLTTRVAGDMIARDEMVTKPLSYVTDKISRSLSAMAPAKVEGLWMRVTTYGVDKGVSGGPPRAFVDWEVTCHVNGFLSDGSPNLTCAVGSHPDSGNPFANGTQRCFIDPAISSNVTRTGTTLIRVQSRFTHMPILAGLFSGGNPAAGWFSYIAPTGIKLDRTYFTWPRPGKRPEGPTSPNMAVKMGASADQTKDPSDINVCRHNSIPLLERFVP